MLSNYTEMVTVEAGTQWFTKNADFGISTVYRGYICPSLQLRILDITIICLARYLQYLLPFYSQLKKVCERYLDQVSSEFHGKILF